MLLFYDCCYAATTTTVGYDRRGNSGVTVAIAACGYESIAPEVDEHSFSKALTETLGFLSQGSPFSTGELHSRIVSRLKCSVPSLKKSVNGRFLQDRDGNLLYERQPRRTPIHTVICETKPRRSIVLGALKLPINQSCTTQSTSSTSPNSLFGDEMPACNLENPRKRRKVEATKSPQILLTIRLDHGAEPNLRIWNEILRQLPPECKEIKIDGIYGSFSTLLLVRMPMAVWDLLPDRHAYSFIGYVTTGNMALPQPAGQCDVCQLNKSSQELTPSSDATTIPPPSTSNEHSEDRSMEKEADRHSNDILLQTRSPSSSESTPVFTPLRWSSSPGRSGAGADSDTNMVLVRENLVDLTVVDTGLNPRPLAAIERTTCLENIQDSHDHVPKAGTSTKPAANLLEVKSQNKLTQDAHAIANKSSSPEPADSKKASPTPASTGKVGPQLTSLQR